MRRLLHRRSARGQAAIVAVVGLLILAVGMYTTYNLSRSVYEKIRLQNAADATAYSLATLEARLSLGGLAVAVQEHGAPSPELYAALEQRGARVTPVPVYRWALPDDTRPLRSALRAIAERKARVALFTSRAQVEHAFAVAAEEGVEGSFRESLAAGVVASIGPVCSEALRASGLSPHVEPEHPKMGHLVKAAAEYIESSPEFYSSS